jgi:hypothetical protein
VCTVEAFTLTSKRPYAEHMNGIGCVVNLEEHAQWRAEHDPNVLCSLFTRFVRSGGKKSIDLFDCRINGDSISCL